MFYYSSIFYFHFYPTNSTTKILKTNSVILDIRMIHLHNRSMSFQKLKFKLLPETMFLFGVKQMKMGTMKVIIDDIDKKLRSLTNNEGKKEQYAEK